MAVILRRRPMALSRAWDWPFRRLFDDLFERSEAESTGLPELCTERRFVPAIDVSEDQDGVMLTAEVAGMAKENLAVTVDNGVLTLKGQKKEEGTTEGADWHRVERRYGHFERRIRLPDYVDAGKIEATYKDGVLKLRMPKAEAAKAKAIQIK